MGKRVAMSLVLLFMLGVMIPVAINSNNSRVEASSDLATISVPPINLPVVTVTLPPIKIPGPPGPIVTNILTIPGPTKTVTVTVPGPTQTATATRTVVQRVTAPPVTTTATVTETSFVTPRQQPVDSGTLDPETEYIPIGVPKLSAIEQVGLGFLAVLFISGLIIIGMWSGYYLGFKESDAKETGFLKALLNR